MSRAAIRDERGGWWLGERTRALVLTAVPAVPRRRSRARGLPTVATHAAEAPVSLLIAPGLGHLFAPTYHALY